MTPAQTSTLVRDQATTIFEGLRYDVKSCAVWHSDIGHLSLAEAEHAFAVFRRSPRGTYTPKPADILAAHNDSLPTERAARKPEPITGCGQCDHGWVEDHVDRHGTTVVEVAACPRCRPSTHQRNLAGEYQPDAHLRELRGD